MGYRKTSTVRHQASGAPATVTLWDDLPADAADAIEIIIEIRNDGSARANLRHPTTEAVTTDTPSRIPNGEDRVSLPYDAHEQSFPVLHLEDGANCVVSYLIRYR